MLSNLNLTCYLAELFPEPGASLWNKIKQMIDDSEMIIVLYTKNAYYSPFVNQELGYAHKGGKRVIPIVDKGVEPKGALAGLEYIEIDSSNLYRTLSSIADAIRNFLKKKEKSDQATGFLILLGVLALLAVAFKEEG